MSREASTASLQTDTKQASLQGPDAFVAREATRQLVTVKLTSIEHLAKKGNEIATQFDILLQISGGGANPAGSLKLDSENIPAGSTKTYSEWLFTGEYPKAAPVVLKFLFNAFSDTEVGEPFFEQTDGANALHPGTQHFSCPVPFSGGKSTLVIRGRVDLV